MLQKLKNWMHNPVKIELNLFTLILLSLVLTTIVLQQVFQVVTSGRTCGINQLIKKEGNNYVHIEI